MFIAIDQHGNEVNAKHAKRNEKYYCPVCNSAVQLKSGTMKQEHFSHVSIHMCERYLYRKESEMHLKLKHDLYLKLSEMYDVKMECYLENIQQIPDLLVENKLALEIQLSKVSPTIILSRTKGYKKERIDVIWLLKEEELNIKHGRLLLTQFHYAVMKDFVIYTVNDDLNLSCYVLAHNHYQNEWTYVKEDLRYEDLFNIVRATSNYKKRSHQDVLREIKLERNKRSYLNPTIGYLYQLSLSQEQLPQFLYYLTPSERFINNNPLEWKLYLYHAVVTKTYDFKAFLTFLNFRNMYSLKKSRDAEALLQEFKEIYLNSN